MEVFAHLAELFFELLTTQADRAPVPTIASVCNILLFILIF